MFGQSMRWLLILREDGQDLTDSDELQRKKKTLREAPWPSEDRSGGRL